MIIKTILPDLLRDQRGATAVEYGLIAALVVLGAMAGFQNFANGALAMWSYVSTTTTEAMDKAQEG